jgi:hypothetical protein
VRILASATDGRKRLLDEALMRTSEPLARSPHDILRRSV